MIVCPICGKSYVEITPSHAKKHGMTLSEFKQANPGFKCSVFGLFKKSQAQSEIAGYIGDEITKRLRRGRR